MKTTTRAMKKSDSESLWDSPLLWSTVALYSIAALVFFWPDFVKIVAWVGA